MTVSTPAVIGNRPECIAAQRHFFWLGGNGAAAALKLSGNTLMLFMQPCSHIWLKGASSPLLRGSSKSFLGGTDVGAAGWGKVGTWKSKLHRSLPEWLLGCLSVTDWLFSRVKEDLRWIFFPFPSNNLFPPLFLPDPAFTDSPVMASPANVWLHGAEGGRDQPGSYYQLAPPAFHWTAL